MSCDKVAIAVLLTATSVLAHHGAADFDPAKRVRLSGTITETQWVNPHALIYLRVTNTDGTTAEWLVECPPPNAAKRRGLARDALAVGTELVVEGYQAKDESNTIADNFTGVTQQDGKLVLIGGMHPEFRRIVPAPQ